MRRALALLLAIVLPLKALAAVVVPIAGAPNHGHAAVHQGHAAGGESAALLDGHGHAGCPSAAEQSPSPAGTLHDHACPHLAMATMVPATPALAGDVRIAAPVAQPAQPFVSIVLDLPVPPPTRRS